MLLCCAQRQQLPGRAGWWEDIFPYLIGEIGTGTPRWCHRNTYVIMQGGLEAAVTSPTHALCPSCDCVLSVGMPWISSLTRQLYGLVKTGALVPLLRPESQMACVALLLHAGTKVLPHWLLPATSCRIGMAFGDA